MLINIKEHKFDNKIIYKEIINNKLEEWILVTNRKKVKMSLETA